MKKLESVNPWVIITGVVTGAAAVLLTAFGNPKNMGFCIACFLRDIAGSLHLHGAENVQYFRPEIVGIVLGAFVMSLFMREFKPRAGSSPVTRFVLGFFVMIGALVFLGCPLRMVIRMGGGDVNAFVGLLGFGIGILIGIFFLKRGFSLKRNYAVASSEGFVFPGIFAVLFALVLIVPTAFLFSEKGPGSMHAPIFLSLAAGLVVGALAQKSRLCMVGGMRDAVMFKDFNLILGFVAIFVTVLIGNIILGNFKGFSATLQPVAHSAVWANLLGMVMVGWGSVLLGGCPLRQLILAGEGNADSAITVLGMMAGAAISHNFGLAGSPDAALYIRDAVEASPEIFKGGIGTAGWVALGIGFAVILIISLVNSKTEE